LLPSSWRVSLKLLGGPPNQAIIHIRLCVARAMKTAGIVVRPKFKPGVEAAQRLLPFLEKRGLSIRLSPNLAEAVERPELGCQLADMRVDFVVTIGGDGTILYTARSLPPRVPLLPVNLHSFGYLAECEADEAIGVLEQVLEGKYGLQEAIRLSVRVPSQQIPEALNDVALHPREPERPLNFDVNLGGSRIAAFRSDGIVIATPTGSTGHALSLGGPVLSPELDAFLLVAIAPLRHGFLPLVVPGTSVIEVKASGPLSMVVDGDTVASLPPETPIELQKSDSPVLFLRSRNSFHRRLQTKLLRCWE